MKVQITKTKVSSSGQGWVASRYDELKQIISCRNTGNLILSTISHDWAKLVEHV